MGSRILRTWLFCLVSLASLGAQAAMESALWLPSGMPAAPSSLKPVAIIYFNDGSDRDKKHATSIQHMARQAEGEFGLKIRDVMLEREADLAATVERIAEGETGLIVIVAPGDREALAKIPSLYPDIRFTIIDLDPPEYFPNAQSMVFTEPEGMFMIGMLAAIHSKRGAVEFLSSENDARTRNLAFAFMQGARYARSDIEVIQRLAPSGTKLVEERADAVFLLDDDHLQNILRNAKQQKRMIILFDHDLSNEHPGVVLTSLLKRYDLAVHSTLRDYQRGRWKAGSQPLGLTEGYIDYALNNSNKEWLHEEMIERLEMTKDLLLQGVLQVAPLEHQP